MSQGAGDDHILRRQSHDQRQTHQAQLQHTADMGLKQISRQISAEQGEHRKKGRYSQRITTPTQVPFPLRHPQDTFTRSEHRERYSSIHYTYTDTFIHSLYPHKYLQLLTAPMRIPLFIHYTCMDIFIHSLHLHGYLFFFFFCCPINCADLRGTAPAPLVLASLTSSHTQGSFHIAAPPPEVHRK